MPKLIKKMVLNRIDFVDVGANPDAFITLYKRKHMPEPETPEATEDMAKQLEALSKRVTDAEANAKEATDKLTASIEKNAALETQTKDLVEKSEHAEFVAKCAGYKAIMKADDFAPILRKVHKTLSEDERKVFYKWLDGLNDVAKNSVLFKELGVGGSEETGSAYEKLEKMAAEIRKVEPALTKEQAIAKAAKSEAGSKLYSQYLEEEK